VQKIIGSFPSELGGQTFIMNSFWGANVCENMLHFIVNGTGSSRCMQDYIENTLLKREGQAFFQPQNFLCTIKKAGKNL
jgi:hypothetical protein